MNQLSPLSGLVVLGLLAAMQACTTTEVDRAGTGVEPVSVSGPALDLVAIWIIDVEATLDRIEARRVKQDSDLQEVKKKLQNLGTQVGLFQNGTFILRNRQPDNRGILTVEGTWTLEDGEVTLVGLRESGRPATPVRKRTYTLEDGRLHRKGGEKGKVHLVLKRRF